MTTDSEGSASAPAAVSTRPVPRMAPAAGGYRPVMTAASTTGTISDVTPLLTRGGIPGRTFVPTCRPAAGITDTRGDVKPRNHVQCRLFVFHPVSLSGVSSSFIMGPVKISVRPRSRA